MNGRGRQSTAMLRDPFARQRLRSVVSSGGIRHLSAGRVTGKVVVP